MEKHFEINENGNNIRCKAYLGESKPIKKAVMFCTGFAGHKDNNVAKRFAEKALSKHKDIAVITFNWPAHGDDIKKKLVLKDCDAYLETVINEVKLNFCEKNLYAYGNSFGGYLVLKYISEHDNPFHRIALRCPAINMKQVLTRSIMRSDEYDRIMKGKNATVGFDRKIVVNQELLNELSASDIRQREYFDEADNIIIFHGTKDEVVPFEESEEFAERNVIEFVPVEGADHRFQKQTHTDFVNKKVLEFFYDE